MLQYPFENFYADDHLATMMLIDANHRALDFQYILWRFDTKDLDYQTLNRLDNGPGTTNDEDKDEDDDDSQAEYQDRKKVETSSKSSCCTIF